MPFAAVLGGALAALLFVSLQWLGMQFYGGFSKDGWMFRYVFPLIGAGSFGYFYVYIASMVAPSAKFTTGVAMTSVYGAIGVLLVVLTWINPGYPKGQAVFDTVRFAVALLGALNALGQVRRDMN